MLKKLKKQVCQANLDLVTKGLVIETWGNASGVDREKGVMVIKPSGVPYDGMTVADLVVVDLAGRTVEGRYRPSTDLPSHLALYAAWPSIGGVVHTHSTYATAFAQAGQPIPCFGTTHADHFHGAVPLTRKLTKREVAGDYEANTGKVIVECFSGSDPLHMPAVLVANHGPFSWGRDARDAVHNAVALEEVARMALATRQLNPRARPVASYLLEKHFDRKHSPSAYYGQRK